MKIVPLRAVWSPLGGGPEKISYQDKVRAQVAAAKMSEILKGWLGARYMSGQRRKGEHADCIGFACSVLDELDGRPRASDPLLPPDAALHDPARARRAVAALRRLYAPARRLRPEAGLLRLEPGDLLVAGVAAGGPGHLLLVGPKPNQLWQCSQGAGVHFTGWALGTGYERLFAAYRLEDRWRWIA